MAEYATFQYGGVTYPLPSPSVNSLLQDADPSLFYVLSYFQSVLGTYMGARLVSEAAKAPAIAAVTNTAPFVVPYDPVPFLAEQQFQFPLLAVYRQKDTYIWKTIAVMDDAGEWCVDFILPPLTGAQMERLGPILRSVPVILQDRIENTFDPGFQSGALVWQLAGLEEIRLETGEYAKLQATTNLVFPAWRGKLRVKENLAFANDLLHMTGTDTTVAVPDNVTTIIVAATNT